MEGLELLSSLSLVLNEDVMQRSGKHACGKMLLPINSK